MKNGNQLRIFFCLNESGCAFWRGRLPAEHIRRQGLAEVIVFSLSETTPAEMQPILSWANMIIAQTPAGAEAVCILSAYQKMGKMVVCDYDDLIFNANPYNPAYKTLGLKEVKVRLHDDQSKERWLWKDGVEGFSLSDNRMRFMSFQDILHFANAVTTTTSHLKNEYVKLLKDSAPPNSPTDYGAKIHVIPNSVDFDRFRPFDQRRRDHSKLRIGWTASSSHICDFFMVEDVICDALKKWPTLQFVIAGDVTQFQTSRRIPQTALELHGWTDLSVYPMKLASLEIDIGICPLQDNEFNRAKSALKWSEFGALGIPCVVSDLPSYECVRHDQDGLKARADNVVQSSDWIQQLGRLIEDPALRLRLGTSARERNFQDFNIATNARLWVGAYSQKLEEAHAR